jgi:fatty acid desaturase
MITKTLSGSWRRQRRRHYTDSIEALQAEFRRRGWDRPATGTLVAQFIVVLAMMFGGLAFFVFAMDYAIRALGLIVSTMGLLGVSTQAHTASHGAFSDSNRLNRFLTYLGYPVILGLSAAYWRNKHIATHHKAPNVEGFDDDIHLLPLFALTHEQVERGGRLARFYYRYIQWLVVVPAISLNALNMLRHGWQYLLKNLVSDRGRNPSHWLDLGALVLHVVLWIGLPMLFFPPAAVLGTYFLRMVLAGYAIFAAFAPAHIPVEAAIADISQRKVNFVLRQTATSLNFRTGPLGRLLCAGVDYQIEHHLFCKYSHVYYPAMSRLVREYCERHGYPYRTLGWGEGIVKSVLAFARPRPLTYELQKIDAADATRLVREATKKAA